MGSAKVEFPVSDPAIWCVQMLGTFTARRAGREQVKFRSKTSRSLLAFLALQPGREFPRFELEETFWPDSDPDRQAQNLRKCLSDLRQALEDDDERGAVLLNQRSATELARDRVVTDVGCFKDWTSEGRPLQDRLQAIELYEGPLLAPVYDAWVVPFRLELEEAFAAVVIAAVDELLAGGQTREATQVGRKAVRVAPLREDVHVSLIRAYGAAGLPAEAMRQYEELERLLDEHWGEVPSAAAEKALTELPRSDAAGPIVEVGKAVVEVRAPEIVLVYRPDSGHDAAIAADLAVDLRGQGFKVADLRPGAGLHGTQAYLDRLRTAEAVIVLASKDSAESETVMSAIDAAASSHAADGRPRLLSLAVGENAMTVPGAQSLSGPDKAAGEVAAALQEPAAKPEPPEWLELTSGAVRIDSSFYIVRETDRHVEAALQRSDSTLLIKGPRQMGKTSLLGRCLAWARERGFKTAITDFQTLSTHHLENDDLLYRSIAHKFARDLKVPIDVGSQWNAWLGSNSNLEQIVEEVISQADGPVLWAMDEADRLFNQEYTNDFFGLLRGWHNRRTLEPQSAWSRLTLAITYATEAHLFITDLNQSPFNVGLRLELSDFDNGQIRELNERYARPLKAPDEIERLADLTGGHPFLSRKAYDWLVSDRRGLDELESIAAREDGPFADHLHRMLIALGQDARMTAEVRRLLAGEPLQGHDSPYRLTSGGLIRWDGEGKATFRSPVYRDYLSAHLR